jgi:hypothetical protein
MAQDYFTILGLTPGRHTPREITGRFLERRARLLADLDDPRRHQVSRRDLEELHLAYAALCDPRRQDEYLRTHAVEGDPVGELRTLIAASLEDGLLRHSRRQAILERAAELGINEFRAQLLIAQVQFDGDEPPVARPILPRPRTTVGAGRAWARLAGAGALAAALFMLLVRWLGV